MAFNLIQPYFVVEGNNKRERIKSFPGVYRLSVDNLIKDICEARDLGIRSVLLFGFSNNRDACATGAYSKDGVVQKAVRAIKKEIRDIAVITDVCLCGYTWHGHCGIIEKSKIKNKKSKIQTKNKKFYIDKNKTLKVLAEIALSHAQAGADLVAPSAMAGGQVKAIRAILDKNAFKNVRVLAYSAKYASGFYGPFREALKSSPRFGDRSSYQLDYNDADAALKRIKNDIKDGAAIVMVKPALAYLDIVSRAKQCFADIPVAAYNVSGEYVMIKKLAQGSKAKEKELALEALTSIKRAGADMIISYFAKEAAAWLK